MRTVHAIRRLAAGLIRRMGTVRIRRHAARALPAPDGEPAVIARTLMAHAAACTEGAEDSTVDALCSAALRHRPGDVAITAAAANWFLVTGRPELAVLACEDAFGHNAAGIQYDHGVQAAWGEALLLLDRAREAVWRLQAACAAEAATVDDWAMLARACCRCGRYDEALEAGQRAAQRPWLRPDAADSALVTMATAHYCLGQMDEAEGILLELLTRLPRHGEAHSLLNKVRNFQGKGMRHDS